jgi:hypothetical protein
MDAPALLAKLLDVLWTQYKRRVVYASQYQKMVEEHSGKVQNDHIAFRTFNAHTGEQPAGVEGIARIFMALGYARKDQYVFEDKNLTAWHYEHKNNPDNPKIFLSQLEVDALSPPVARMIKDNVANAPDLLLPLDLKHLDTLGKGKGIDDGAGNALAKNLAHFFSRPWPPPQRTAIAPVNAESQYAAWTLLHGNAVNHFTAYINAQNVRDWPDLETTVEALRRAGLPMKDELEGERGSKLRQSSTQAAEAACEVTEKNGRKGKIMWSYAYYEFAERGKVPGPKGKPVIFQGFLGAQATNLFEMTKRG